MLLEAVLVFVMPSCVPCVDGCPSLKVVFGLIESLPEDYEEGSAR